MPHTKPSLVGTTTYYLIDLLLTIVVYYVDDIYYVTNSSIVHFIIVAHLIPFNDSIVNNLHHYIRGRRYHLVVSNSIRPRLMKQNKLTICIAKNILTVQVFNSVSFHHSFYIFTTKRVHATMIKHHYKDKHKQK